MTSVGRPRKRPANCRLPPPSPPPAEPFKLYVRFPTDAELDSDDTRCCSLTFDSDVLAVSITALKARCELTLGLPDLTNRVCVANCYWIRYGNRIMKEDEKLRLGRDVPDGTVLTACPCLPEVGCVVVAVYRHDADQLQDLCGFTCLRNARAVQRKTRPSVDCRPPRSLNDGCSELATGRDDVTGLCLVVDPQLAFIAMCVAAADGCHDIVDVIGNSDGDGSVRKLATPFGRTALHVACANDNDRVVNLLLAFHYDPLAEDGCKKTPDALAQRYEAGLCSLLIRRHQDMCRRKRNKQAADSRLDPDEWYQKSAARADRRR